MILKDRLEARQGDITTLAVDAIVNAANTSLLGGGGVDGAIHRAAGPEMLAECQTIGGCPTGEARITQGYRLPARYVIHTVGPVYRGRPEDGRLLADCYTNSLGLAMAHGIRTMAFPAISCGVYGYPMADASKIAVDACIAHMEIHALPEKVIFTLFSATDLDIYARYLSSRVG
jgi:O-acetyl-ADP-ribose deacetylase (regulator of RNase III)